MAVRPGDSGDARDDTFGVRLRRARELAGLTQEELATRAGLSINTVGGLERGEHCHPYPRTVRTLASALGLSDAERRVLTGMAPRHLRPNPVTIPPVQLSPLIGRDGDVAAVSALVREGGARLVTLTGPGGVGKTALGLRVAAELHPDFGQGAAVVPLAALQDPALVAPTIVHALNVVEAGGQSLIDRLTGALHEHHLLLVLDNFEHLLDAAPLVTDLLSRCPRLTVLATSRATLRLAGEHVYPVPSLVIPDLERLPAANDLADVAAVRLFVDRARAADPAFAVTDGNAGAVAALCNRLDGLPLAIELAAARSVLLPPAAMLPLLERRLPLLTGGRRDAPARHQTIQDAIAWSYDLLAPEEQAFFRRLSVFAGGWTLEAAAAIGDLTLPEALERLDALADQSLVVRRTDTDASSPRFAMLETIRAFGLERLSECGDEEDVRDRHAAFFRDLVVDLDLYCAFPGDRSWFGQVAPDEGNLRQALGHFLDRGDTLALSELSGSLEAFWLTRCQFHEGRRWLELAIAHDEELPTFLRARNRAAAGVFILYHDDADLATPILEEAVALARTCSERFPLEQALQALGNALVRQGEFVRAMAPFEEAEHIARTLAPAVPHAGLFVGANLCFQGIAAKRAGDHSIAVARFTEAMPFLRAPGGGRRLGMLLGELGVIQIVTGNAHEALPALVESVALTWDVRDDSTLSRALRGLGAVATVSDQPVAATYLLGAADAIDASTPFATRMEVRDRDIVAWCLTRLAGRFEPAALDRMRHAGAGLRVEQAVALARTVAISVLGDARVDEIWHATGVPDPGHSPPLSVVDRVPVNESEPNLWELTRREREVLVLLCQRQTDNEIAQTLFISPRTASGHVANVMGKLGAANRRDAAAIADRHGLV